MARYTGPRTKISRRYNEPIMGASKALAKKAYPPGMHGKGRRKKQSEYAIQLAEKQKAKYTYGVLERQFANIFTKAAKKEGITPSIYSHPIGHHGHAAGPAIGMWDKQDGVPGTGDYPLYYNTLYAIELNAKVPIKEWNNKELRVMLEQNALFTPDGVRYTGGRQKDYLLIAPQKSNAAKE